MNFKNQTNELNKIPIRQVGEWLGVSLPARGSSHCPFHDHDDKKPSFEVRPSGNRWICYGCGRRGGSIDLVKVYKNVNFLEAKRWLADRARLTDSNVLRRSSPLSRAPKPPSQSGPREESSPDHELYEMFQQMCPLLPSGREYLVSREISDSTVKEFGIGQVSDSRAILSEMLRIFGFKRLNRSGLLTKRSSQQNARLLFPNHSLVFPFFEKTQIVYLQARALGYAEAQGKWWNLSYHRRRLYNVGTLLEKKADPIAICEGIMDTLSAVELGINAIGMMGVTTRLASEHFRSLRGREVNILLDWDKGGEARSTELQNEMRRFGISSTRKRRPSATATDLNEYLIELRGLNERL